MAKINVCFCLVLMLAFGFKTCEMLTRFYLQNICIDGQENNQTFYVNAGARIVYENNDDYKKFIDCQITLKSNRKKIGLYWTNMFIGTFHQNMPTCKRAFVEVWTANKKLFKFCGNLSDLPSFYQKTEFDNIPVTIRLFVNFTEPEVTPSTWLPTTEMMNETSTWDFMTTNSDVTEATIIPFKVNFGLDFTAFSYCSSVGPQEFMCHRSRRCLDKTLRCDTLRNCVSPAFWYDKSDETQCQDPPPPNLTPLWIILAILLACFIVCWCFYKPGYFVWRVARCRNIRCCGRYFCSGCFCRETPCSNCFSGTNGRTVSPIGDPDTQGSAIKFSKADDKIETDNNSINEYQNSFIQWMDIKYDDGNHQRELR